MAYRIFLRPSNVDFDNAINAYPSFDIFPGDNRNILISKVNLLSISSEDNPCIEGDFSIETSCIYKKVFIFMLINSLGGSIFYM